MSNVTHIYPKALVYPDVYVKNNGAISPSTNIHLNMPPLKLFIVIGEPSGDALAAGVVNSLANTLQRPIEIYGLAGENLNKLGLQSIFPISDISVMGLSAVLKKLPLIYSRILQTVNAIIVTQPNLILYCDSPDFSIRVARRVRKILPEIPQIKYICPSVWAWRPKRAKQMYGIYSQILAILPFEPKFMLNLGGPKTDYVGHPLLEKLSILHPSEEEFSNRYSGFTTIIVLPGSRLSEVTQLMPIFGETLELLEQKIGKFIVQLPTTSYLLPIVKNLAQNWKVQPQFITCEAEKYKAFRSGTIALAASGTVTLELALAHLPSVVAYKVDRFTALLRFLVKVPSIVLPNLIAQENGFPEFVQENCTAQKLCNSITDIITSQTEKQLQIKFCKRVIKSMQTDEAPTEKSARIIAEFMSQK